MLFKYSLSRFVQSRERASVAMDAGVCVAPHTTIPLLCLPRDLPLCFLRAAEVRVFFIELCKRVGQVITKIWPECITLVQSCTISPFIFFCSFLPVSCLHSQPDVIFFRLLPEARKWKPPILPRISETWQSFTMETKLAPSV